MIPLTALWIPILVSAVIVFFASFIMHMVLSYHKSDYRKLPDEDRVTDAMRSAGVTRGPAYFFPYCSFEEMKSAPMIEKMKRGPVGLFCAAQRPTGDGKEYGPLVFVLFGDQPLCRLSFQPDAGACDRFLAGIPCRWYFLFTRIRRSPRPGIDLERPKLGSHFKASFR
jgi:hypothetical protein